MVTQLPLRKIAFTSRLGPRPAARRAASWHIAMAVAIVGFVLRALVPLGFMPDARALQAGHIELTLCSPNAPGARSISILLAGDAADMRSSTAADTVLALDLPGNAPAHSSDLLTQQIDCPFGLMAAQGVMRPPEIGIAFAATFHAPFVPLVQGTLLALPTLGPPLGSRAPPAIA